MKLRRILFLLTLLASVSAVLGGGQYYSSIRAAAFEKAEKEASLHIRTLQISFSAKLQDNLKPIRMLAGMDVLSNTLMHPDQNRLPQVNMLLDHFQKILEADICYLMNAEGTTIASTNRDTPVSFVGKNYGFRPYFQQAMLGSPFIYMAKGVTSKSRGIYYSYPVMGPGLMQPVGVVVVKINAETIQDFLFFIHHSHQGITFLVDSNGIIFISENPEWHLKTLTPLTLDTQANIAASRQFGDGPWEWCGLTVITPGRAIDASGSEYLISEAGIDLAPGWRIIHLSQISAIQQDMLSPMLSFAGCAVIISCFLVMGGAFLLYRIANRDLTHLRQAEQALRSSEKRFRELTELMPEMLYESDVTGKLTFCNPNGLRQFGLTEDNLSQGVHILDCILPEDADRARAEYARLLNGEAGQIDEYTAIRTDGTRFPALIRSAAIIRDDIAVGFRGVVIDITDRIHSKTEKQNLEIQLRHAQKMEAIGSMAGGIAHHFNNLLMGIIGNTSLMLLNLSSDHPHRPKLERIEALIKKGSKLTAQLLGFARGGKYEVLPTNPNRLIQNSVELFGQTRKDVSFHLNLTEDPWITDVDRGQMDQVLLNLFVNAGQAMPGGGVISLQTRNVVIDSANAHFYQITPGRFVNISVSDTGIGMTPETLERIFDPFFTTRETGAGIGLGLASAYGIIRNHGGSIQAESQPGAGSTFTILIPASEKKAMNTEFVDDAIRSGNETILLIDDEEMILDVGGQMLEKMGYTVKTARSGSEGLDIFQKDFNRIHLVIMDMVMPDMAGINLYEHLKATNSQVKVLLSSGFSMDERTSEILGKGCNGFIQKPYTLKRLSQKIREILT